MSDMKFVYFSIIIFIWNKQIRYNVKRFREGDFFNNKTEAD